MLSRCRTLLILCGLVAMPVQTVRANLIVNGDFEAGTFSPWTTTGNVFFSSSPLFPTLGTYVNFNAFDSTPNGTLSQIFATTRGQSYSLRFLYTRLGTIGSQETSVTLTDTATQGLLASRSILDDFNFGFLPYDLTFTATGAQTTLRFTDTSAVTASVDSGLDNVSVVATAVPEPSTLALGTIGLLAGLGCRWHRRNRPAKS